MTGSYVLESSENVEAFLKADVELFVTHHIACAKCACDRSNSTHETVRLASCETQGANWALRKLATFAKPSCVIKHDTSDADPTKHTFEIVMDTHTPKGAFKWGGTLDESEFEYKHFKGGMMKAKLKYVDENKAMLQTNTNKEGKINTEKRHFVGDLLVFEITANDVTMTRKFKKA